MQALTTAESLVIAAAIVGLGAFAKHAIDW
jgi:hypothetical protein